MSGQIDRGGIVLMGLGPGGAGMLTREAWDHLNSISEIWLRTSRHPCVSEFPKGLILHSFDDLYDQNQDFKPVYLGIIERVLEGGRAGKRITYAVPGHPFIAETTGPEIFRRAREEGIPVRVIEGMSFLEPCFRALGLDPFDGISLADGLDLARRYSPDFPPDKPALVAQVYSREVASEVKLTLGSVYPDTHPVVLVHAAGTMEEHAEHLALYEIDRSRSIGLLSALYVPPLDSDTSLEGFQNIVAHLRAPEGCPWDREQTISSMRNNLLEETYEVLEAMDGGDMDSLAEELGDLLLIVCMLAQMAMEDGDFGMADVIQSIHRKIVRRHPHVFGEIEVNGTGEVLRNWEEIKAGERRSKGGTEERKGILDGINPALPALTRAQKFQDRAAHVGFDWPDIGGVREKLAEEWREVAEADQGELEHELGDLLFSMVNLIRWHNLDAESALRLANQRFQERFGRMEQMAAREKRKLADMTIEELERLWQKAKEEDQREK